MSDTKKEVATTPEKDTSEKKIVAFDYGKQFVKKDDTAELELDIIANDDGTIPTLIMKHAGHSNTAWRQQMLLMEKKMPRTKKNKQITTRQLDEVELLTAEVYAKSVVVDWKNFKAGGEDIPFSPGEFLRFVKQMLDPNVGGFVVWDEIIRFSKDRDNFIEDDDLDVGVDVASEDESIKN